MFTSSARPTIIAWFDLLQTPLDAIVLRFHYEKSLNWAKPRLVPATTRIQVRLVITKELANPGWHDSWFNGLMNTANSAGLGAKITQSNRIKLSVPLSPLQEALRMISGSGNITVPFDVGLKQHMVSSYAGKGVLRPRSWCTYSLGSYGHYTWQIHEPDYGASSHVAKWQRKVGKRCEKVGRGLYILR